MPNAPVCDQGWTRAVVTSVPVCHQGRAGAGHGLCAVRAPPCLQPLACALTLCSGHCLTSPSSKALFCWLSKMKSGGSKQLQAPLPSGHPRRAPRAAFRARLSPSLLEEAVWQGWGLSAWIMGALKS